MSFASVRIAVAGTHSTGKSTFLSELEADLTGCGLRVARVGDVASAALARGFPILRDHVYESTLWIMAEGMRREMDAALGSDVVLVDRPVFDALGYLLAALDATGRTIDADRLEELRSIVRAHVSYYDWIAVTVLDRDVPLGEERDPDLVFREAVARRIDEIATTLVPDIRRLTPASRVALRSDAVAFVKSIRG